MVRRLIKRSLVARLVAMFCLVATLAVSLLGLTAYWLGRRVIEQSVIERLSIATSLKEQEIERWVDDQRKEVQLLAGLPLVRSNASMLANAKLVSPEANSAYDTLSTYLRSVVKNQTKFDEIFVLNQVGRVIFSTDPLHEGTIITDLQYTNVAQFGLYIENIYPNDADIPTMTIASPLFDRDNNVYAILAANVNLSRLDDILVQRVGLGRSSETYLVDSKQRFVSSKRFGRPGMPIVVDSYGIQQALARQNGVAKYQNYAGEAVVGVYHWLEGRDLILLSEVSQAEAFAPARELSIVIFTIGLVLEGLALLAVFALMRQVVVPVAQLTEAAVQVAEGNLQQADLPARDDELGLLIRSFTRMTKQLRANREQLEDQVALRTNELRLAYQQLVQLTDQLQEKNDYLQQGLKLAHDIQIGLLSQLPPWNPDLLRANAYSLPSAEVGGDFYSFVDLGNGRVGMAIGDISGKGVGAALMMALVSSTLEERAREGSSPAVLLQTLNTLLIERLKANRMNAAVMYAVYDQASASLQIANAGMVMPYLLRAGNLTEIEVVGLPIGSRHDVRYQEASIQLKPDDHVVFVSDGVVEARNPANQMLGFELLTTMLAGYRHWPAIEPYHEHLFKQISNFMAERPPVDDITILWLQK
ncbi:SpoIIE family protein phosphatase [Herpetosiphon giganteus]|uniref:SpoIIE family protein phosphatase n=1 Tax=Herpetosiphon giganteus TaxID=2029754 RepID=UPI00195E572B|nr:SpoIIE family protein phosphatase [Herpetosiphon giganteus]MBM7842987.1 serine phosphatase RsbU (regulator of sigma subunit) [Herpetosiphon giganteus]